MDSSSIQLEKCYLDSIKVVVNHNLKKDLILTHGTFLKQMAANLGGEIAVNQVNDQTPPEKPRLRIVSKETILQFSLNRFELEIKGLRKHVGRNMLEELYKNRLKELTGLAQSYLLREDTVEGFSGIVAPVRFPQNMKISKEELISRLHLMMTGRSVPNLVNYSSKIGLNVEQKFENFELREYEVKNINLPKQGKSNQLSLRLEDFPTVEHGIMVIIDINNKPSSGKYDFNNDFPRLLQTFFYRICSFEEYFSKK